MAGRKMGFVCLAVLLVNLQLASAKPFFGFWCSVMCEDDDGSTTTTTTTLDDMFDDYFDICAGCPTRTPPTRAPATPNPAAMTPGVMPPMAPMTFMIPPSTGMNVTLTNVGGSWMMNMVPVGSSAQAPSAAPATPPGAAPAPEAPPADATTAAPTTAAP